MVRLDPKVLPTLGAKLVQDTAIVGLAPLLCRAACAVVVEGAHQLEHDPVADRWQRSNWRVSELAQERAGKWARASDIPPIASRITRGLCRSADATAGHPQIRTRPR